MLMRWGFYRDPHGSVEVSKMGVDFIAFSSHQNEFSRLIRRDRQADAQLFQNTRQVAG